MGGGELSAGRTERLDAEETMARLLECPRINPGPVVQRTDSSSDLGGSRNRVGRHLGPLAIREVVVLPQLVPADALSSDRCHSRPKHHAEGGLLS